MGESKRRSKPKESRRKSAVLNVKPDLAELIKMRKLQGNTSGTKMIQGNFKTRRQIHHSRIENQIPDNVLTHFHAKGTSINQGISKKKKKLGNSRALLFNNLRDKHIKSLIEPHSFIGINLNTGKIKKKRLSIKNKLTLRKGLISNLERKSKI